MTQTEICRTSNLKLSPNVLPMSLDYSVAYVPGSFINPLLLSARTGVFDRYDAVFPVPSKAVAPDYHRAKRKFFRF